VHLPWLERSAIKSMKSEAGFRADRQAGTQLDTRLDFIDMDIAQTGLIDPQTDELMVILVLVINSYIHSRYSYSSLFAGLYFAITQIPPIAPRGKK
jgi:hypothetical protein